MIFVTSDTHYNHANIIELANRPFKNIAEMNDELIKRWNSVVQKNDTVYHLGDVCFGIEDAVEFLTSVNGNIILIRGNHDHWISKASKYCKELKKVEISTQQIANQAWKDTKMVMCHYPLSEWYGYYKNYLHFHGHTHGTIENKTNRWDIGVDVFNFTPVSFDYLYDYKVFVHNKRENMI